LLNDATRTSAHDKLQRRGAGAFTPPTAQQESMHGKNFPAADRPPTITRRPLREATSGTHWMNSIR